MFRLVKFKRTPVVIAALLILTAFYSVCHLSTYDDNAVYTTAPAKTDSVDIPIIMYHAVSNAASIQGDYVISPEEFEEDLKYLAEHKYNTVFVSDLVDYVNGSGSLPENPIVLSFDDGYYNNYLYVYPLLQKYNCKAIISPIAYFSELYTENGEVNEQYTHCTWAQLEEMHESGYVEIGNHTYNMHSYGNGRNGIGQMCGEDTETYKAAIKGDIEQAQNLLTDRINVTCDVFAYPFGIWCDSSLEVLKDMNFKAVLTIESGINHLTKGSTEDLYTLKRLIRPHGRGLDEIMNQE